MHVLTTAPFDSDVDRDQLLACLQYDNCELKLRFYVSVDAKMQLTCISACLYSEVVFKVLETLWEVWIDDS